MLNKILEVKRREVAEAKRTHSLAGMIAEIEATNDGPRGFLKSLQTAPGDCALIAEVKKASPSKGVIVEQFDPVATAKAYESGGAACVSVLTDEQFFMGSIEDLKQVRSAIQLPVLRKDFVFDEFQVAETRFIGADCMLLIAAAFEKDPSHLNDLHEMAIELQLDVIVEVHEHSELESALKTGAQIIGINNRNLSTFQTDLAITERLASAIPKDRFIISESAIHSRADVERVVNAGARAVLVGESLVTKPNIEDAVRELIGR